MKGICAGIAFFLMMFLAACADGLMDEYGITVTCVVSAIVLGVSCVLIQISNLPERRNYD